MPLSVMLIAAILSFNLSSTFMVPKCLIASVALLIKFEITDLNSVKSKFAKIDCPSLLAVNEIWIGPRLNRQFVN